MDIVVYIYCNLVNITPELQRMKNNCIILYSVLYYIVQCIVFWIHLLPLLTLRKEIEMDSLLAYVLIG